MDFWISFKTNFLSFSSATSALDEYLMGSSVAIFLIQNPISKQFRALHKLFTRKNI